MILLSLIVSGKLNWGSVFISSMILIIDPLESKTPPCRSPSPIVCKESSDERQNLTNANSSQIDRISSFSFTQALIRVLATSPEDDRPEDYFLIPYENQFIFKRIDNDRLFCDPVNESIFLYDTVTLKSIIYFLDHLKKPLDLDLIQEYLSTNPLEIVSSLINQLEYSQKIFERNV